MAVYKVPQDVEAEDKFLGPLTFKQFLFMGGVAITGYLIFICFTKQWWPLIAILLPFFLGFGALAFPWSKDQPTELWLASRIRFMFMPRKRIWDQSGVKDLVEINVPKRPVHVYSDGLSQDQVRNRLNALATVVDTRGWAVKNLSPNNHDIEESDRLVGSLKRDELNERAEIVNNTMDVLDEGSSPVAEQFTGLIQQSTKKHHDEVLEHMRNVGSSSNNSSGYSAPATPQHFSNPQTTFGVDVQAQVSATAFATTPEEAQLLQQIHHKQEIEAETNQYGHLKTIQPIDTYSPTSSVGMTSAQDDNQSTQTASTTPVDPAILTLAHNDDLSVQAIAHQVDKDKPDETQEVVVSLH